MNISSVAFPAGLHAIYIRSALPAMQVDEQTVTGLGWPQTISTGAWRCREMWEKRVLEMQNQVDVSKHGFRHLLEV